MIMIVMMITSNQTNSYPLHHSSLCTVARWWKTQTSDAATGTHSRGQHILGIEDAASDLGGVQIGGMNIVRTIAVVSFADDRVENLSKHLYYKMNKLVVTCKFMLSWGLAAS